MTRWCDSASGGRELQRLGFRDDIVACADAREVIANVRKDRNGLGFFVVGEVLTEQMLRGVKVLPVAAMEGGQPIAPTLETVVDGTYPLSEPVTLYVHPNAPKEAWDFCKFATGPEAAKIVKQSGLWPEYDLEQLVGKDRLAALRRGKGATIRICDVTGSERLLNDVVAKFVKAKAAVRLTVQKGDSQNATIEKFFGGGTDMLLTDRPMATKQAAADKGKAALTPFGSQKEGEPAPTTGNATIPQAPSSPPKSGSSGSQSPRTIVLGRMAVGIVVHPKNLLNAVPMDELQSMLCGEVKQWPGANKSAGVIHVFGLQHNDPITRLLKEKLIGTAGKELKHKAESDTAKVVLAVTKDPFAIGFVDLSRLPPQEKSVKLVDVYVPGQPVKASASAMDAKTITKEASSLSLDLLPADYPLARTFTLYVSPNASQIAKDFADFAASAQSAEVLAQYNVISSSHAAVPVANREATARDKKKTSKSYLGNQR
jgi:ABC-type phosphate transport system substrate-binding protein